MSRAPRLGKFRFCSAYPQKLVVEGWVVERVKCRLVYAVSLIQVFGPILPGLLERILYRWHPE